jgi:hypothetical protein
MLNSLASVMESSNVCLLAAIPSRSPRNAGGMSRLNRTGGHMPDPQKFNLAEWLVPPYCYQSFWGWSLLAQ